MKLPDEAEKLIELINSSGYSAYAVGGFVRDSIMNRECGDIDIASSTTPLQLEKILDDNDIHYIETGIKHGTVTAIVNHITYEITAFRCDGEYNDSRHPDSVEFITDLKVDLARRDFTINAIAYNNIDGIVDVFGGQEDIKNKLIRCVGNADKRFNEDALRIMRALRFASVLGFDIEEDTKKAIFDNKQLLLNIASERIYTEFSKLLIGDNVERILLEYRDVFAVIMPEIVPCFDFEQNSKWHLYDVYTHIVKSVAVAPKNSDIRLALFLHDIGKPYCKTTDACGQDHFKGHPIISVQLATDVLKRLKVSNATFNKVLKLIEIHDLHITQKPTNIKKWLRELGEELTLDFIDVKIADMATHNLDLAQYELDTLNKIKQQTKDIIANAQPYKISDLAINGNDLIAMGYEGRAIACELDKLVQEVSANPNFNTKDKLISQAQKDKMSED